MGNVPPLIANMSISPASITMATTIGGMSSLRMPSMGSAVEERTDFRAVTRVAGKTFIPKSEGAIRFKRAA
jgi:hypothetical protein